MVGIPEMLDSLVDVAEDATLVPVPAAPGVDELARGFIATKPSDILRVLKEDDIVPAAPPEEGLAHV
eukprot:15462646-Alexandrium_andersonii.AAC.1